MPTLNSITKTIRINPQDLEIIKDLMKDGTTWSGAIHKLCEIVGTPSKTQKSVLGTPIKPSKGTPKNSKEALEGTPIEEKGVHVLKSREISEIESMCKFYGVKVEEFLIAVLKGMESGQIGYEDGELKTYGEVDLSELEEVCHEKNITLEDAIKKCIQMIKRS